MLQPQAANAMVETEVMAVMTCRFEELMLISLPIHPRSHQNTDVEQNDCYPSCETDINSLVHCYKLRQARTEASKAPLCYSRMSSLVCIALPKWRLFAFAPHCSLPPTGFSTGYEVCRQPGCLLRWSLCLGNFLRDFHHSFDTGCPFSEKRLESCNWSFGCDSRRRLLAIAFRHRWQ